MVLLNIFLTTNYGQQIVLETALSYFGGLFGERLLGYYEHFLFLLYYELKTLTGLLLWHIN